MASVTVPTVSFRGSLYNPGRAILGLNGENNVIFGTNFDFYSNTTSTWVANGVTYVGATNPGPGYPSVLPIDATEITFVSSNTAPPLANQSVCIGFMDANNVPVTTKVPRNYGYRTVLIASCRSCGGSGQYTGGNAVFDATTGTALNQVFLSTATTPSVGLANRQSPSNYDQINNSVLIRSEKLVLRLNVVPRGQTSPFELQKLGIPVSGIFVDEATGKLVMRAS